MDWYFLSIPTWWFPPVGPVKCLDFLLVPYHNSLLQGACFRVQETNQCLPCTNAALRPDIRRRPARRGCQVVFLFSAFPASEPHSKPSPDPDAHQNLCHENQRHTNDKIPVLCFVMPQVHP